MAGYKMSDPQQNTSKYMVSKPETAMGSVVRKKKLAKLGKVKPGRGGQTEEAATGSPPYKAPFRIMGGS